MPLQGTKLFIRADALQNLAEDDVAEGSFATANEEFEQLRLLSPQIAKEVDPDRSVNDCRHDGVRFARS